MSKIKIHELPEIRFPDVKPTDIFVIENKVDTWQIPLADLKLLFSNDVKIQAIYEELISKINNIITSSDIDHEAITKILSEHTNQINALIDSMSKITARVVSLESNVSTLTADLVKLTTRVTKTETRLDAIDKILDSLDKRLKALESDNKSNKDRLDKIETKDEDQDDSITDIYNKLKELKELIDSYNGVSMDTINAIKIELTKKIEEKYLELLTIIDECHHNTPIIE